MTDKPALPGKRPGGFTVSCCQARDGRGKQGLFETRFTEIRRPISNLPDDQTQTRATVAPMGVSKKTRRWYAATSRSRPDLPDAWDIHAVNRSADQAQTTI